jgi:hypothetical protein
MPLPERDPNLRDYTIEEIAGLVPVEIAQQVEALANPYIWTASLLKEGTSTEALAVLENNTGYYDDDIEDALETDPELMHLYAIRRSGQDTVSEEVRSRTIRIRRTVVIRAILAYTQETPSDVDNPAA